MKLNIATVFNSSDPRTIKAKINILGVGAFKLGCIILSLILIPITINYVDEFTYGIWLTVSSIISWISFFDIGINNGLRNKLAEAIARKDIIRCKKLISTTYFFLALIFVPLMFLLLIINNYIDWSKFLHLSNTSILSEIRVASSIIIVYFCSRFILSTITIILLADLKTAYASFVTFLEQLSALLIIVLFSHLLQGGLVQLAFGLCFSPLIVLIIFSLWMFLNKYKIYSPSYKSIDLLLGKEILSLGGRFFIIQIASVVLFQSANFIIIRSFGALDVTHYNISYKYFSVLAMLMTILIAPLWSTATEASANNDFEWIRNTVHKYLKIGICIFFLGIMMLAFSSFAYKFWINDQLSIPFSLSVSLLLFNLISVFGSIFCSVLNGLGRLKYQYLASLLAPLLFLGLCYLFIKVLHLGVYSIVIAMIIANFNAYLIAPIEYYYVISHLDIKKR